MFKIIFRWIRRLILVLGLLGLLSLLLPRVATGLHAVSRIFKPEDVPAERVVIVFGAGLRYDGSPTAVLRDRVQTAANLYFSGKAEKLLMSGDNSQIEYNEPGAMHEYALSLGVPEEAIVLDYAGRRTYDTCYRAKAIFGVEHAILVTQGFHLPRALFLCESLGIHAVGVVADNYYYRKISRLIWNTRELVATLGAVMDVFVYRPLPVLGEPEPIFVNTQAG